MRKYAEIETCCVMKTSWKFAEVCRILYTGNCGNLQKIKYGCGNLRKFEEHRKTLLRIVRTNMTGTTTVISNYPSQSQPRQFIAPLLLPLWKLHTCRQMLPTFLPEFWPSKDLASGDLFPGTIGKRRRLNLVGECRTLRETCVSNCWKLLKMRKVLNTRKVAERWWEKLRNTL